MTVVLILIMLRLIPTAMNTAATSPTTSPVSTAPNGRTTTQVATGITVLQYTFIRCRCYRPTGLCYCFRYQTFLSSQGHQIQREIPLLFDFLVDSAYFNNGSDTSIVILLWSYKQIIFFIGCWLWYWWWWWWCNNNAANSLTTANYD